MHAVHLLGVLLAVTLYLITPHEADQQNQRNGDQDEMQRLQEQLERTRQELAVEQRLGALERQLQQQNRELQSLKRKQKQVLRRLHGVETTLSEQSHGNHQEERNAHMDSDEVIQKIESMDKQLAMLNDSHQQDDMKLKQSEEVKEAQNAQYLKLNQLLATVETSENHPEQIRNDKTSQSQASFHARRLRSGWGSDAYSSGDRLIYQTPLINPGGHYNSTSGEYTCPTSGVYMFMYSVYGVQIKQGSSHSCVSASLYSEEGRVSLVYYTNFNNNDTYISLSHSDLVSCQAGQKVWIQGDANYNFINGDISRNVFGGVLLYST